MCVCVCSHLRQTVVHQRLGQRLRSPPAYVGRRARTLLNPHLALIALQLSTPLVISRVNAHPILYSRSAPSSQPTTQRPDAGCTGMHCELSSAHAVSPMQLSSRPTQHLPPESQHRRRFNPNPNAITSRPTPGRYSPALAARCRARARAAPQPVQPGCPWWR